jgi:hypothetical protein
VTRVDWAVQPHASICLVAWKQSTQQLDCTVDPNGLDDWEGDEKEGKRRE